MALTYRSGMPKSEDKRGNKRMEEQLREEGKMKQSRNRVLSVVVLVMMCVSLFSGCGKAAADGGSTKETASAQGESESVSEAQEEDEGTARPQEEDGDTAVANNGTGELISDEDAAALQYMKKYMVEDVYGDGASYEVYAPDGSDNEDGFLSYIEHGLNFFASVYSGGGDEMLYMVLNESVKSQKADWESNESSDIQLGEVIKNGPDRYVTATATAKDFYGTDYKTAVFFYLDVPKPGVGIIWQLETNEMQADETTAAILTEIGQCYGISLESLLPTGEWAQENAQRQVDEQDIYEPGEGEPALTKVEGYQYMGQMTMSFEDGKLECPVMVPMGRNTDVYTSNIISTMHGVTVSISSSYIATDQYVPYMKESAERWYQHKCDDESVENRDVHKSDIMEMAGYEDAYYYIVDYETPDSLTGEYYREVNVNGWIPIEENYILSCSITLRTNDYDGSTNTLLGEVETAYGVDLSEYYNEE